MPRATKTTEEVNWPEAAAEEGDADKQPVKKGNKARPEPENKAE